MEWDEFVAVRKRIIASHRPISGGNLTGMMADFYHMFGESGLLSGATINKSGNLKGIIEAHFSISSSLLGVLAIQTELERIWTEEIRYRHYDAYCIRAEKTSITLDGITMPSNDEYYVTVSIAIELLSA